MKKNNSFSELVDSFEGGESLALSSFETGNQITYAELYNQIHFFIARLHDIKRGDNVVIFDIPNIDWVCIYFAIILRGGVVVPIDTRVGNVFLENALVEIKPRYVISNSKIVCNVEVIPVEQLRKRTPVDLAHGSKDNPEALAEILFTSGTWGIPKGVMLSQKNILTNAYQILNLYLHKTEDTSLAILPMSHAYQQTAGLIVPLLVGSHIVFLEKPDSFKIIDAIKKYEIKTTLVVPKILNVIRSSIIRKIRNKKIGAYLDNCIRYAHHIPVGVRKFLFSYVRKQLGESLENFVVGGALLSKSTDDFFRGLGYNVAVGYGLSETSPVISISVDQKRVEGNVGKIVNGLRYEINEKGELVVSGNSIFLGYYPDHVAENFNTGDIVTFDDSNNIILRGRSKNLIIWPTGDKIFAEDLEYLIAKNTKTEEVCVVYEMKQDLPVIYCAIKSDHQINIDSASLHAALPNLITLQEIKILRSDEFPYTHTLKPNRKKILELFTK